MFLLISSCQKRPLEISSQRSIFLPVPHPLIPSQNSVEYPWVLYECFHHLFRRCMHVQHYQSTATPVLTHAPQQIRLLCHKSFHLGIGIITVQHLSFLGHICGNMRYIRRGGDCPTRGVLTVVHAVEIILANPLSSFGGHHILTVGKIHESVLVADICEDGIARPSASPRDCPFAYLGR